LSSNHSTGTTWNILEKYLIFEPVIKEVKISPTDKDLSKYDNSEQTNCAEKVERTNSQTDTRTDKPI